MPQGRDAVQISTVQARLFKISIHSRVTYGQVAYGLSRASRTPLAKCNNVLLWHV